MKQRLFLFLWCLGLPVFLFAQSNNSSKQKRVVMVVGKPLASKDSLAIKQLFFAALREKVIENFGVAMEEFKQVLEVDPANDASMYQLASLKKLKNDYAGAKELLEKAVTVQSDNEWYWLALADCYEKNNEIDKLENVFNELIRLSPDKIDYYFDKANVYYLQQKYDDALAVYQQIEQIAGLTDDLIAKRQTIYLKQGKIDKVGADLQAIIAANPKKIRYYLFLAEVYNSNGLADKAVEVLQSAKNVEPANGQVHLALADIYRDKKRFEDSFNELILAFNDANLDIDRKLSIISGYFPKFPDPNAKASALELSKCLISAHPNDAKAYALYGDMLVQNANYQDAKVNYKKAILLNGKIYQVYEQLIRVELAENDENAALKDGENALSLFPNQAWLNYLVGAVWQQKKNYKKALEYLGNASTLETEDKELLMQCFSLMGDCYHSTGEFDKSDDAYEKSLAYNPDNAYTLNNYAYYLSLRGVSLEKAAAMSSKSNQLQPNSASFEDTYAWILFKQKKYENAKVWIEKALVDDKDRSPVKFEHYGDILFNLGDVDTAVQNWKKAKENGGGSSILDRKINERKYIE